MLVGKKRRPVANVRQRDLDLFHVTAHHLQVITMSQILFMVRHQGARSLRDLIKFNIDISSGRLLILYAVCIHLSPLQQSITVYDVWGCACYNISPLPAKLVIASVTVAPEIRAIWSWRACWSRLMFTLPNTLPFSLPLLSLKSNLTIIIPWKTFGKLNPFLWHRLSNPSTRPHAMPSYLFNTVTYMFT